MKDLVYNASIIFNLNSMWEGYLSQGQPSEAMLGWLVLMPIIILALVIWSSVWKGIALWRAGRNNQLGWFIALFIINTVGILEIVYLLTAGKKKDPEMK